MIALSLTSSPTRVLLLFPSAYSITFFFFSPEAFLSFPSDSIFPLSTVFSSNENVKNQVYIWGLDSRKKIPS